MEAQSNGVQISQDQRQVGSLRQREISYAGQVEVSKHVW